MGTTIRPETSTKNPYWIEKHRYYELKHFCLQYPIWKRNYISLDGFRKRPVDQASYIKAGIKSDPTAQCAAARIYYSDRMKMIEDAASSADPVIATYILKGVTEGASYTYLRSMLNIPCCKEVYYNLYRKFFWILNAARQ